MVNKNKAKIVIVIIIVFLIYNLFLEIREICLFQKEMSKIHPFLQSQPIKNDKKLHINSFGFRGGDIRKKGEDVLRIFILGGSTVFSDRTSYENSHTRILEKKLQEYYPDIKIEVFNAGYHWYTTQHSLINYLFKIRDFDPDIIIMWHGINDLCRSFSPPEFAFGDFQRDYSNYYGSLANLVFNFKKIKPPIIFSRFKDWVYAKLFGKYYRFPRREEVSVENFPSLESFRYNIELMVKITEIDGVKLILATQPTLYKKDLSLEEKEKIIFPRLFCHNADSMPDIDSMIYGMEQFNFVIRECAKNSNIGLIDLDSKIPKNLKYLLDDCHYTREGNFLIASIIFEYLVSVPKIKE